MLSKEDFLSYFLTRSNLWESPRQSRGFTSMNEVYYDAFGSDAPSVFTEILGEPGTIRDVWALVGINGANREIYRRIDLTGAVVPDDGLLVIATGRATLELVLELDFIANVDWQNGPDAVQLWSATGTLVDALQYGDAGPGNAGEGAPGLDAPPGLGLTRRNGSDSNDNATDFVVAAPTPGRRARPLAEPRSLWLLSLGDVLSLIGGRVLRGATDRDSKAP